MTTPARDGGLWRVLVRSFLTLLLGEGAARMFSFVAMVVLARRLGPGGFGTISFAIAVVAWFGLVVDSGTEFVSTSEISREPHRFREIAERVLGLRIALAAVSGAIFVGAVLLFVRSPLNRDVYLRFGLVLPAVALNLRWMVLGVRRASSVAIGNVVSQMLLMGGVLLLVVDEESVFRVPYFVAASELVYALVIMAALVPSFGWLRPRYDLGAWKTSLRRGVPLMVSSFARGIIYSFDLLVIGIFLGPRFAGYYSVGSKPVQFIATAIGLFYISFIASYSAAPPNEAATLFRRSTRMALATTVPVTLVASFAAPLAIPFVFGNAYQHSVGILALLAWKIPLSALSASYNGALLAEGHQVALMRNNVTAAAVNATGDIILVPLVGIYGAVVVNLFAAGLVLTLNYRSALARGIGLPFGEIIRTPRRALPATE